MVRDLQVILLPDLFEFAYVPNWFDHLSTLAEMAMPESWRFTHPVFPLKNTETPILERYIKYVFRKQVIDFNNFPYESDAECRDRTFCIRNEKACFNRTYSQRTTRASTDAFIATNVRTRCKTGISEGSLTMLHPT